MTKNIWMKIIVSCFVFLFVLLPSTVLAAEHKLENLDIHVYLHEDGSATITEKRLATLSEGTENYDIIGDLGKSTIRDFTVEENGQVYEFIDNWDIDASREDKAFKNGIIKKRDYYELAWGIGEYGQHEYKIQYTVTDFIKQLDDSQVLFWRFVNDETNIPPENVRLEIEADDPITEENERIWGFGFEGEIHFNNDKVLATSDHALSSSNYVTALIKFPDGRFATNDVINQSFDEVQELAFDGSDYQTKPKSFFGKIIAFIAAAVSMLFVPFIIIIVLIFTVIPKWKKNAERKQFRAQFKERYFREVPYDGRFTDIYELLNDMNVSDFENLISTFILKWINEERIHVETEKKGMLIKSDVAVIYLLNTETESIESSLEKRLFSYFKRVANKEGKVTQAKFSKWVQRNRTTVRKWEKDVKSNSRQLLMKNNLLKSADKGFFKFSGPETTKAGKELEGNIYMFMNYLKDFSLLNEHEPVNVKIWDDLMIWAALVGLTDEVYKQFKKLYPQYEQESIYTPVVISSVRSYSNSVKEAKTYSSSGSGGGTSVGGGGGSFGGGSGGGTR